jgi:hypothetical protein
MDDGHLTADRDRIVATLRELVEALDRRVARVERVGEARIARDADSLRREALQRIEELTSAQAVADKLEAEASDAVVADDGAPPHET